MTFAERVILFNKSLSIDHPLPKGVEILNPYQDDDALAYCSEFYHKYYNDHQERTLILGINPGRFGGGITGIPFTDPVKLAAHCEIPNDLPKKTELSADFIYKMIARYGGPEKFYGKFFISAISPLGFTKDGKNLNYYDIRELQENILDFIIDSMRTTLTFDIDKTKCYCLGEGENFKFLNKLNQSHQFFKTVIPLPHPRFIMQYRRKQVEAYAEKYVKALSIVH
jgi:hypothetical protein